MTTTPSRCKCGAFRSSGQPCKKCGDPARGPVICSRVADCPMHPATCGQPAKPHQPHEECRKRKCIHTGWEVDCIPVPTPDDVFGPVPAQPAPEALEAEITDLRQMLTEAHLESAELRQRLEEINTIRMSSNAAGNARIKELEADLDAARETIQSHYSRAERFREERNDISEARDEMRQALKRAEKDTSDLHLRVTALQKGQESLQKALENTREECERLKAELAQERKLVEFLEEDGKQTMATLRRESASLSSINWLVSKLRLSDALAECDGKEA